MSGCGWRHDPDARGSRGCVNAPGTARLPRALPRGRRALLGVLALVVSLLGLAAWVAPGRLTPAWTLGPLHGHCVGVMQLALAGALWRAWRRADDEALVVAPLHALGIAAGVQALATLGGAPGPAAWGWGLGAGVVATLALAASRSARDVMAPAERPDRAFVAVSVVSAVAALAVLLMPAMAAAAWPWRTTAAQAAAYAGPFAAVSMLAQAVARERRRYVRRALLPTLLALAIGVLATSVWHAGAFAGAAYRPAPWIWFSAFAALAAMTAARLVTLRDRH